MPKTSRRITVHPLTLREVEVVRVADLTPGMRRITLAGAQLGEFTSANGFPRPAFDSTGFDDDIRLVFCYPGQSEPVLPVQTEKGVDLPRDPRPLSRIYTVRRWDAAAGELDIDVVKHGIGVGTTWAYRAQVGDRIHFFGPSASRALPHDADWLLVAGDDTTIPAIARLLEELPEDTRAQVLIEIAANEDRQQLRELPGVEVTWLVRDGAEAGTTTHLLDAVRNCGWWDGRPFAWIAGQQAAVRDIRRHLVEDRAVPKEDIEFIGYWRRGEVVALEQDAAVPDPEKTRTPFERLHDLTELIAPVAIRTAVELGVPELISRGVTSVADLAVKVGADERALGKLLRYLHTLDILTPAEPDHYRLTPVGEVLTVEFVINALHPAGVVGREMLGIHGLTASIRTGRASYASVTGQTFAEVRAEQDYEDRYLERLALFQATLAEPIAASDILKGVRHLVLHSGGAGAQAREFVAAHPHLHVTICALPAQADWLRRDLPATIPDEQQRARVSVAEQSVFEPSPAADAVFVIRAFKNLADADAAHALRRAAENLLPGGRVLLVEDLFDTGDLDEHDGEADLLALAVHGSGLRTGTELDAVITRAGLVRSATHTVGWGTTIHELAPSPR
ncbi:NADPH-dependent ferric siderophore reductase [Actinoplanes lutulentus]|uniref:NADPH-dependent ferric siderophore reductase n=1 Tax=Actinoplanes lutulentus TaxID=1287878 RepID=A0A327ZC04_9ACTN|nr:siderophore-interacting protein [Actinoplanes lutulentus]MBB2947210.1 NADPH-dependent ferric siderophore reductase [Actinoplanes lutulentus]RAK36485.1 NADPH-dependent ferric siderophore reductase [Actinoplanes lutulentus]